MTSGVSGTRLPHGVSGPAEVLEEGADLRREQLAELGLVRDVVVGHVQDFDFGGVVRPVAATV